MQFIDPKGSFLKNLVLSLLLLGVSSLLIPVVLKQIDDRKAIDQQRLQDQLSRQDKVLDAQATLLDSMASDFWDYEAFLRLYDEEVLPLDACLLELMKREATNRDGTPQPVHCSASAGKFAGASWDTLAASIVRQDLAESLDREFESLAKAFRLQDPLAAARQMPAAAEDL